MSYTYVGAKSIKIEKTLIFEIKNDKNMRASIEISLYPLSSEYKSQILDFIASLKVSDDIQVSTGELSTLITGEYHNIMNLVRDKLEMVFTNQRAVAVLKIVPEE